MTRDARRRKAFSGLAEARGRPEGRTPGEAARTSAQADAYRRPSACGHWRSQTMGADCGLRRTRTS